MFSGDTLEGRLMDLLHIHHGPAQQMLVCCIERLRWRICFCDADASRFLVPLIVAGSDAEVSPEAAPVEQGRAACLSLILPLLLWELRDLQQPHQQSS